MDEKIKDRIKKLQALAERGVRGEKETAQRKLTKLLEQHQIFSLDELEEDKREYYIFSFNGKHEKQLLMQCIYKIMGAANKTSFYRTKGTRQKITIQCAKLQKIEIDLEFGFYRDLFYEELKTFTSAFIQAQQIFPVDAPIVAEKDFSENYYREMYMAKGIKTKSRKMLLEQKNR